MIYQNTQSVCSFVHYKSFCSAKTEYQEPMAESSSFSPTVLINFRCFQFYFSHFSHLFVVYICLSVCSNVITGVAVYFFLCERLFYFIKFIKTTRTGCRKMVAHFLSYHLAWSHKSDLKVFSVYTENSKPNFCSFYVFINQLLLSFIFIYS